MSYPPATKEEVVYHFLKILAENGYGHLDNVNWGCDIKRPSVWDIPNTDSYINGILMKIDFDFHCGYLLEVVDLESGVVSYFVVMSFYGPNMDSDKEFVSWKHDSSFYEGGVGTFFEREFDQEQACMWGVQKIFGLISNFYERES